MILIPERPSLRITDFPEGGIGRVVDIAPSTCLNGVQRHNLQGTTLSPLIVVHADEAAGPHDFDQPTLEWATTAALLVLWQPCTLPDPEDLANEIANVGRGRFATVITFPGDQGLAWAFYLRGRPSETGVRLLFPSVFDLPAARRRTLQ